MPPYDLSMDKLFLDEVDKTSMNDKSTLHKATLEALTSVLRDNGAYLGGSAIGKGFRHAARFHLRKRAPLTIPLNPVDKIPGEDLQLYEWDDSALEPGVQHCIEDPFYVVDLGIVGAQLARWRANFPRVVPYYAVKCNPDPAIVRTLAALGCNFDCASRGEIELVQQVSRQLPTEIPKPDVSIQTITF